MVEDLLGDSRGGENRRHYESLQIWKTRGTLTGLRDYLVFQGISRARIYEVCEPQVLLVVVPGDAWPDLGQVLQDEWAPVTARVVVFPTLGWWECRWSGIQIHTWGGRQLPLYDIDARRVQ